MESPKEHIVNKLIELIDDAELRMSTNILTGIRVEQGFSPAFPHIEIVLTGELPIFIPSDAGVCRKVLTAGDAVYIKEGASIGRDDATERELLVLNLRDDGIECYHSHHFPNNEKPVQRISHYSSTSINLGCQKLISALEWFIKDKNVEVQQQLMRSLLTAIQNQLVEDKAEVTTKSYFTFKMVLQYLKEHCHLAIDRQCVSHEFGLSSDYLSHLFQKYHNESFHNTLIRFKMDEATHLLTTTRLTIEEIARQLGYPETSYFIKVFRRIYNTTPGKFRTQ